MPHEVRKAAQVQHRQNSLRHAYPRPVDGLNARLQTVKARHRIPHFPRLLLEDAHLGLMNVTHVADDPLLSALRIGDHLSLIRVPASLRLILFHSGIAVLHRRSGCCTDAPFCRHRADSFSRLPSRCRAGFSSLPSGSTLRAGLCAQEDLPGQAPTLSAENMLAPLLILF